MVKKQVLLMLSLYLILGVIALFNFNFHHLLTKKFTDAKTVVKVTEREPQNNIAEYPREHPEDNKISSSDQD